MLLGTWQNSYLGKNSKILSMYNAVQIAVVTINSYKPLSGLNFARYTQLYGSYMSSSPLGSISPWSYSSIISICISISYAHTALIITVTLTQNYKLIAKYQFTSEKGDCHCVQPNAKEGPLWYVSHFCHGFLLTSKSQHPQLQSGYFHCQRLRGSGKTGLYTHYLHHFECLAIDTLNGFCLPTPPPI